MRNPIFFLVAGVCRIVAASLVARGAASAPAAHALNFLVFFKLRFRNTADTCRVEVGLFCLDTPKAAELGKLVDVQSRRSVVVFYKTGRTYLLVSLLLPLGNEHGIGVAVLEQPVVQLLANGLFLVVQLVDVAAALVGDLEDGPLGLVLRLAVGGRRLGVLHLVGKDEQVVLDVVEAFWWRLAL